MRQSVKPLQSSQFPLLRRLWKQMLPAVWSFCLPLLTGPLLGYSGIPSTPRTESGVPTVSLWLDPSRVELAAGTGHLQCSWCGIGRHRLEKWPAPHGKEVSTHPQGVPCVHSDCKKKGLNASHEQREMKRASFIKTVHSKEHGSRRIPLMGKGPLLSEGL